MDPTLITPQFFTSQSDPSIIEIKWDHQKSKRHSGPSTCTFNINERSNTYIWENSTKKKRQILNINRDNNIMTVFGSKEKYIFNIDTKIKNVDGTIVIKCEKDKNIKIIFETIEDFINILLWIKE